MLPRYRSLSFGVFVVSVLVFFVFSGVRLFYGSMPKVVGAIVIPVFVYGVAHVLRAIRLGVLLGGGRARRLLGLYFYTAACSAVIPFKLGEVVRINEVASWTGSYWRGLLIIWLERVFDVVALGAMTLLALKLGAQEPKDISLLLWVIGCFVFITLIFFFVVPEQLRGLNLHVMRSYKGRKAVYILCALDSWYQLFGQVRPLLEGKMVTLSLLTLFIWGMELLALAILFDTASWLSAVNNLVRQFGTVFEDSGQTVGFLANFEDVKMVALIVLGVFALWFYGKFRMNANKECN